MIELLLQHSTTPTTLIFVTVIIVMKFQVKENEEHVLKGYIDKK